jgi:energy-coupling factor transporter ATP-binding protein EcfA2
MIHGESLVMRILDKGSMKFDLRGLGMDEHTYGIFSQLIRMPHGIILVTGPTGSGKTTTLYSSLLEIRSPENKIITTEDPVEYQLDGINQIQVHAKIGLTSLRRCGVSCGMTRMSSLVGEIRDQEPLRMRFKHRLPVTWYLAHCTPTMLLVPLRVLWIWESSLSWYPVPSKASWLSGSCGDYVQLAKKPSHLTEMTYRAISLGKSSMGGPSTARLVVGHAATSAMRGEWVFMNYL